MWVSKTILYLNQGTCLLRRMSHGNKGYAKMNPYGLAGKRLTKGVYTGTFGHNGPDGGSDQG